MRRGETDSFPIRQAGVWVIVVWSEGDGLQMEHFNGPLDQSELPPRLESLKGRVHAAVGMWPGQWRTDSFELDPGRLLERLRDPVKWEPAKPPKCPGGGEYHISAGEKRRSKTTHTCDLPLGHPGDHECKEHASRWAPGSPPYTFEEYPRRRKGS
jgi:hypothetical protein